MFFSSHCLSLGSRADIEWHTNKNVELELRKFSNLPVDSKDLWKSIVSVWFNSFLSHTTFLIPSFYISSYQIKPNFKTHNDLISFKKLYLTGDGVGARMSDGGRGVLWAVDCCQATVLWQQWMVVWGGDLDFGLGGILGGVFMRQLLPQRHHLLDHLNRYRLIWHQSGPQSSAKKKQRPWWEEIVGEATI